MNTFDNKLEQLGQILKKARIEKEYSIRKVAELSKIASNAEISMLENAKRLKPDPIMLKAIAKILDLNYIELFQLIGYIDEDIPESLSKVSVPLDQEIKVYSSLSTKSGKLVFGETIKTIYLPHYDNNCFALLIKDDSMEPKIPNNSIVIVDQNIKELEHRNISIFTINGEPYIRRIVKQNGKEYFVSDNPNYDPIFLDTSDKVVVVGKVIKLIVENFI